MRIRIWAGQEPFANARRGPTRLLENESCEWALSARLAAMITPLPRDRCQSACGFAFSRSICGAAPEGRQWGMMTRCRGQG